MSVFWFLVVNELLDHQRIPRRMQIDAFLRLWAVRVGVTRVGPLGLVYDSVAMIVNPMAMGVSRMVVGVAVPADADAVTADVKVLCVQGLVSITDKVEQEFHRFLNCKSETVNCDSGGDLRGLTDHRQYH
jgi:hypothetical protein